MNLQENNASEHQSAAQLNPMNTNFNILELNSKFKIFQKKNSEIKKRKIIKLSFIDHILKLFYFCKTDSLKRKLRNIEIVNDKLMLKFDWIHFLRFQNEYESIKSLIFTKENCDLLATNMSLQNNDIEV
jgi:hypothetical protein